MDTAIFQGNFPHCPQKKAENKLVGGFSPTPLKNMLVKMASSSPIFGVNMKNIFQKPPPRLRFRFHPSWRKNPPPQKNGPKMIGSGFTRTMVKSQVSGHIPDIRPTSKADFGLRKNRQEVRIDDARIQEKKHDSFCPLFYILREVVKNAHIPTHMMSFSHLN